MCKIFALTSAKKLNAGQLESLTKSVAKNMTSERDGFGVMAKKQDGSMFIRRFLVPSHASVLSRVLDIPFAKLKSNGTGQLLKTESLDSIVFHGRTSTNFEGLINTHPISKHGMHLVHNGVVEDSGPKYTMQSQNDTEHMLERIFDGSFESTISGYYATMHYRDHDKVLTILKDATAYLYFTWSDQIESYVFGSTENLIQSVLKSQKISHGEISEMQDSTRLEFLGNAIQSQTTFKPKGRSVYADSKAELSLGRSLISENWSAEYADELSQDEISFLASVSQEVDHSCIVLRDGKELDLDLFFELDDIGKLECDIVLSDGTFLSLDPSINGRLFDPFLAS